MAHILLVEDFAVIRRLIEVAIAPLHHTFVMTATGEEAVASVEAEKFDLIMLDIGLPGMDGWDFLRWLSGQRDKVGDTPVLVVTAHGDRTDEDMAFELGAAAFVSKPFRPEDLMKAVEALVGPESRA